MAATATPAKEMRKRDLMDIAVFKVARKWLRCVGRFKGDGAGEKKTGKKLLFTVDNRLNKAEEHAQEDRRETPISGLRSGESTKSLVASGTYAVGDVSEPPSTH